MKRLSHLNERLTRDGEKRDRRLYYLSTSLEDVAIAIVIVARCAWFRQHVRNIVRRWIPCERWSAKRGTFSMPVCSTSSSFANNPLEFFFFLLSLRAMRERWKKIRRKYGFMKIKNPRRENLSYQPFERLSVWKE